MSKQNELIGMDIVKFGTIEGYDVHVLRESGNFRVETLVVGDIVPVALVADKLKLHPIGDYVGSIGYANVGPRQINRGDHNLQVADVSRIEVFDSHAQNGIGSKLLDTIVQRSRSDYDGVLVSNLLNRPFAASLSSQDYMQHGTMSRLLIFDYRKRF
jgi:GNAT superfamily N-acetyltransferase